MLPGVALTHTLYQPKFAVEVTFSIALSRPGGAVIIDARPGTRFMLMAGRPYGEKPVYNGRYVCRATSTLVVSEEA